jgi:1-acyl-sn-glycerol-3-phosphate acyltransferase
MLVGLGTRLVARGALWATRIFFEVGRQGPPLPDGPVLVVANHPNSLVDALVVFCVAGRKVHPLARAPLFDRLVIGQVLRELGGLPIYRPQDDPALVGRNDATFDAATEALARGDAVLVFPEGTSHSEPELAPLRTGAARIALRAEERAGWRLGLRIVPVGLTYRRKTVFRGQAAAFVGEPLEAASWQAAHDRDRTEAVRMLTSAIAERLEATMVLCGRVEDEELLDAAEALYTAERPREPAASEGTALAARLPRLQLLADGMRWLRAHDPERLARLAGAVHTHRARLERLGLTEREIPEVSTARETLRVVGRDLLLAALGGPLVLLGTLAWAAPFQSPRLVLRFQRPAYEAIATVKLATALAAFPLAYILWLVLAWHAGGFVGLGVAALLLPLAGLAALHGREHWRESAKETRFLLLALRDRDLAARLRSRRRAIADEIDRVADEWDAERGRRAAESFASDRPSAT